MIPHPQIGPIFRRQDSGRAVLLLHGFTATPDVMRPLANALFTAGYTVLAPLLSGHGGTAERLEESRWTDWYADANKSFEELKKDHDHVFVAGLSMGGLLTLKLAEDFSTQIKAISLLGTPLWLDTWIHWTMPFVRYSPLRYLWRFQKKMGLDVKDQSVQNSLWTVDRMPLAGVESLMDLQKVVRKNLEAVRCPTQIIHSKKDSTAPYSNVQEFEKRLKTKVRETHSLENSYHLVTVDFEKDLVGKLVTDFFGKF